MRRLLAISLVGVTLCAGAVWAAIELGQPPKPLPTLMPEGALLYIEAKDFGGLLADWNGSAEKRAWLAGDNYAAFSRSRLFQRLSGAQDEFSTTAGIPADAALLAKVAGRESGLGIYDIGNLGFVYVTRMAQSQVETTPIWQVRGRFEQRTEGSAQFYVRTDTKTGRTAAFAAREGWLILATDDSLVAGVLDRLQGVPGRGLPDEGWYADLLRDAPKNTQPDLRMALNLTELVPSPYFRSYWVQQNITEMKQYTAALCELVRASDQFREERQLLRKTDAAPPSTAEAGDLAALAPPDAAFYSAQSAPDPAAVLQELRDGLLERKPAEVYDRWSAPALPAQNNAGSPGSLEERINVAPAVERQSDPWQPLRSLLKNASPTAMLEVDSDRAGPVFLSLDSAFVLTSAQIWDEAAVRTALTATLQPGLTAGRLGLAWEKRPSAAGDYLALAGQIPLFAAFRGKQLLLASDSGLLEKVLARTQSPAGARPSGLTYTAVFRHSAQEQQNFNILFTRLDRPGGGSNVYHRNGEDNPFFSGSLSSLSRTFAAVDEERVEELDQGAKVTQTVIYHWKR